MEKSKRSEKDRGKGAARAQAAKWLIFLFLFVVGCSPKFYVYNNTRPEVANTSVITCPAGIQGAASFIRYHEIKEDGDTALWPEGLPLESKVGLREKSGSIELRMRIANGPRNKITLVYREQRFFGSRLTSDKSLVVYSGKLPYRNYSVPLPMKGGERVEAWFEVYTGLEKEIPCVTGRAMYYVISNENNSRNSH